MAPELDVVLNKKASIERCVGQVKRYYSQTDAQKLATDFLYQDAINLNIQRICELCLDLANFTIRTRKLGLPKSSRDSFQLLFENGIITNDTLAELKGMVGFRNILVHEYTQLDLDILIHVIEHRLDTPIGFAQSIVKLFSNKTDTRSSR